MHSVSIHGLTLFFAAEEQAAATLIQQACEKSVPLLNERWGLATPPECHVYVMTSWLRFPFQAAPGPWKVLLALALPFWAPRARQLWPLAGGLEQQYGQRRTVGIKPPRLIQTGDSSFGDRIFIPEPDINVKVQSITCHELTHAFTSHLRLPNWLKEGLAMVAVDHCLAKPTVRPETLALLAQRAGDPRPSSAERLLAQTPDGLVHLYVRGYWLTRYLDETQPALLKALLTQHRPPQELEDAIAAACGQAPEQFWPAVGGLLATHFRS